MAGEFTHADHSGTETYAQYIGITEHIAAGQTTGDLLQFNGTSWVRIAISNINFSSLPVADPHAAGKLWIGPGGVLTVSAG